MDGNKLKGSFFIIFFIILGYSIICTPGFTQDKITKDTEATKELPNNLDGEDKSNNKNSDKSDLGILKGKSKAGGKDNDKLELNTLKSKKVKDKADDKLRLKFIKAKKLPSWIEIYAGGGYLLELNNKGYELYFSTGVQLTVNPYFEVKLGIFFDIINGSQIILEANKDSLFFYGLEFGTLFYPYKKWFIKPFLGANISFTLYPGIFIKTMGLVGCKIATGSLVSINLSYSIGYTTANNLNSFISHIGFLYISFEL